MGKIREPNLNTHIQSVIEQLKKKTDKPVNLDRMVDGDGEIAAALEDGTNAVGNVIKNVRELNNFLSQSPQLYYVEFIGEWFYYTFRKGNEIITLYIDPDGNMFWMYELKIKYELKEAYISASPINFKIK